MNVDGPWAALAAVLIALITSGSGLLGMKLTTRRIEQRIGPKVDAVHQATTVNHHSSAEPTILDKLDDIQVEQRRAARRTARIEAAIGLQPLSDDELD